MGVTSDLMSDPTFASSVEVLSAWDLGRRRHWSDAEKLRIVEESFVGHRQVSATARRNGVSRSLLTIWRRQYRSGELGGAGTPAFVPLTVAPESAVAPPPALTTAPAATVEIALPNGRRLTLPADIDTTALARLLRVVDGR